MRVFLYIIVLLVLTTRLFAQTAADKDFIDLSAKMDTVAIGNDNARLLSLSGVLNVQKQNDDDWEDIEIYGYDSTTTAFLRFGGALLFDSVNNPKIDIWLTLDSYKDLDGDGIGDLCDVRGQKWFKGYEEYPYFFTDSSAIFQYQGFPNTGLIGDNDYDGDGYNDLIVLGDGSKGKYLWNFKGGQNFDKGGKIIPDESLKFSEQLQIKGMRAVAGTFVKTASPVIIVAVDYDSASIPVGKIGIVRNKVPLSQDSVEWLSSTNDGSGGVSAFSLYATDITADGVTDLIISDRYHLYIYKGGDDFGTYPLIPQNAFYTIRSPRLMDFGHFGFMDNFGVFIHACGDLSGSGTPYLMVGGDQAGAGYHKSYAFFYAGGKALDTLYDGIVGLVNGSHFTMDTLHSINSTGRTACYLTDYVDEDFKLGDLGLLVFQNCENLPHKTNPAMLTSITNNIIDEERLTANCFPLIVKKFVKVNIRSPKFTKALIATYSILGEKINERKASFDAGDNIEFFDTSTLPEGTYVIQIITEIGMITTKFLKQR